MIDTITSQVPEQFVTVLLIGLLIVAFIIAFKVLKMVMETVMVSVISAGFYAAMVFIGFFETFDFNELLLFTFLGSGFYLLYSVLASTYTLVSKLLVIPYKTVMILLIPFKIGYRELKKLWKPGKITEKLKESRKNTEKEKEDEKPSTTKEVVLGKMEEKNEED